MTKERVQIFLSTRAIVMQKKLCQKYGWSPSQFYDRLFSFFTKVHDYCDGFDYCVGPEIDVFVFRDPDTGEVEHYTDVEQPFLTLISMIKEGLTPEDGFVSEDEEIQDEQ